MKTIAIIQARLGSTRLPGKSMADLCGMPVLGWVARAAMAAELVDEVWVATPDPQIYFWAIDNDINGFIGTEYMYGFLGSEDDVLSRFRAIAEKSGADWIVRLTADCPFVDPWLIDECIWYRADSTKFWPDGMDVQVFPAHRLRDGDREHVVNWSAPQLPCPDGNLRQIRLTIDKQEDLDLARKIAPQLTWPFGWQDTLEALGAIRQAA